VIIDELGHSTVSHVIPCVGETDNQSPPDDVVVEAAKGVGAPNINTSRDLDTGAAEPICQSQERRGGVNTFGLPTSRRLVFKTRGAAGVVNEA
jgi:hypothetical protein